MDIEEVAHSRPEAIQTTPVDIDTGMTSAIALKIVQGLGVPEKAQKDAAEQIQNLYQLFIQNDCTQVEINPFVQTRDGRTWCVDAKLNFDDNAEFRHKDIFAQRDYSMEDPREVAAAAHNLNYIGLDGNIGCMGMCVFCCCFLWFLTIVSPCLLFLFAPFFRGHLIRLIPNYMLSFPFVFSLYLVNGAGLAMATMDIIQQKGGKPANFLDVGGGATEALVEEAFKILSADEKVKAILVNIFGGIVKCDTIAVGIVNAAKKLGLKLPLVVRLEGTNREQAVKVLKESGLKLQTALNLDDAAIKVGIKFLFLSSVPFSTFSIPISKMLLTSWFNFLFFCALFHRPSPPSRVKKWLPDL